jgi:hypothetical protein
MALDDIKKLNDEINKLRAELGRKPLKPFDKDDLERAKSLLSGLRAEVREMGSDLDYVAKSFKDSVNELSKQNTYLSDARRALNGIADISRKVIDYRRGESSLSEKQLKDLKNQARIRSEELQRIKDIGVLGGKNQAQNKKEIEESLAAYDLFDKAIDNTIDAQKEVNKQIGLVGTGIEGISKGLSKMGFGNLSQPLTEAIEKTKSARLQTELNTKAQEKITSQIISQNQRQLTAAQLRMGFGGKELKTLQLQKDSLISQNAELSTQTSKYKNIGNALTSQLTKANLIDFAIQQMVSALQKADTQTGQLAKAFGTSYSEATSLRNELNTVANLSGDVNITTGALQESLIAVNKEFGTATMFSGELLKDFTNMTKVMGYTDEAAAKLSKITVATGTDLSDNTAEILGTAAAFNVTNKLALNEKEIVEGVAKASAATTVSLGMQPGKIAAAVVQAKALGLELEQVTGIAESLLNFESSISNELEAELLTGRALNLEQARYLALTNDIEGVAKEIANQGITAAEFGGMNMIQQKAIAEAVGLTKEELAQSLINQQALNKAGMAGKTTQEAYNALKAKGLSDDQIAEELGNKILAQQMKSQSAQEKFNATIEKLKEAFVGLTQPLMPILDIFSSILTYIAESKYALLALQTVLTGLAVKSLITAIASIFTGSAILGPVGLGIAAVATAGLMAYVQSAKSIKDGVIDPKKGVVVSGGFGSVQLDEKDTFIGDKNGIKAGTNLFGNTAQSTSPSISIDISPLVNEMQAVKAVLVQILNKDSNVYMDGAKVGKGINMAKTKIG